MIVVSETVGNRYGRVRWEASIDVITRPPSPPITWTVHTLLVPPIVVRGRR